MLMIKAQIWTTEIPGAGRKYNYRLYLPSEPYIERTGITYGEVFRGIFLKDVETHSLSIRPEDVSRDPPPGYKSEIGQDRPITGDEIESLFPLVPP